MHVISQELSNQSTSYYLHSHRFSPVCTFAKPPIPKRSLQPLCQTFSKTHSNVFPNINKSVWVIRCLKSFTSHCPYNRIWCFHLVLRNLTLMLLCPLTSPGCKQLLSTDIGTPHSMPLHASLFTLLNPSNVSHFRLNKTVSGGGFPNTQTRWNLSVTLFQISLNLLQNLSS